MTAPDDPVPVVLLRSHDHRVTTIHGDDPVPLTGTDLPADLIDPLRDAVVELTADDDLPPELLERIRALPVPEPFRGSPWLHDHRALVFQDGRCAVGNHVLAYGPAGVHLAGDPGSAPDPPTTSFDLLTRPWLPVLTLDGRMELVGLTDLLRDARRYRRLVAEAPTMTAALHRLALALLHRVHGPASESEWAALWRELPTEPLDAYVARFGDRFDLFHRDRPFMQCPALRDLSPATVAKLVPYRAVGNNVTLFDHTTSADRVALGAAEAARWLVTLHSFDPGGMKTPFEKDKSSERAHCNNFGVVLVEGANLHETLLLNAPIYRPDYEKPPMTTPRDRPIWEEPEPPSPRPDKRPARGWTQVLTWPSRRILLSASDGIVDGVVITPGVRLEIDPVEEEMMAAFRKPRDGKGKPKRDAPMVAVRLHPVRGVWRHAVELLVSDLYEEERTRRRPAVISHIARLVDGGVIPEDTVFTLRVFGQRLDSKASVVEAWSEESVPAPVALLRAQDNRVGGLIGEAIALADNAGSALRGLQTDFRRELRAQPSADIDIAYWPRLDRPFADFVVAIGAARVAGAAETPALTAWAGAVTAIATRTADRWVAGSTLEGAKLLALGRFDVRFRERLRELRRAFDRKILDYVTVAEETSA